MSGSGEEGHGDGDGMMRDTMTKEREGERHGAMSKRRGVTYFLTDSKRFGAIWFGCLL